MPELPDLETVRQVLAPRLTGQTITAVTVVRPLVVRDLTLQGFAETLTTSQGQRDMEIAATPQVVVDS
ncbi:MAG: hypothetical protein ISS49_08145 [Anaerolineae bacterium]|nr:hypothetical protein [Anaerolineae bacterium]